MLQWQNITRRCMSKKSKKKGVPNIATSNQGNGKKVIIQEGANFDQMSPSWRFNRFDRDCPDWGLETLEKNMLDVMDCLCRYENVKWQVIKSMTHDNGKSQNHTVKKENLSNAAIKRLNKIKQDDIEGVFSLRFKNKFRIIGILSEAILDILWVDPNHEVVKTK